MRDPNNPSLTDIILPLLTIAALIPVAIVAPNALQLFDIMGHKHRFHPRQVRRSLQYLQKKGYVRHLVPRTSWHYELTEKGRELLENKKIDAVKIETPKRWNGKWCKVIFDIPESLRKIRNEFRWKLYNLGFRYVNLSVWVHPYECQDVVNALSQYYGIGKYVRFMRVEYFDGVDEMTKKFKVS